MHCSHCGAKKWTCLCRYYAEQVDSEKLRQDRKEYDRMIERKTRTRDSFPFK